jgi:hypothetical protein
MSVRHTCDRCEKGIILGKEWYILEIRSQTRMKLRADLCKECLEFLRGDMVNIFQHWRV